MNNRAVFNPRRARRRGVAIGWMAIAIAALLIGHGLLPNIDGYASLLETLLPWFGLLIVLLFVIALFRRGRFAFIGLTIAALVWAVQFVPVIAPHSEMGTSALTVVSENIDAANADPVKTVKALEALHPAVIALQELDATSRGPIEQQLAAAYPHNYVVGTVGVWSTTPLSDAQPLSLGLSWKRALRVDVQTSKGPVQLYVVHMASVRPGQYEERNEMLSTLRTTLAADHAERLAVVGDFNSASTDRAFEPLTSVAGEAPTSEVSLGFTWPAFFPVARLDHALVRGMDTLHSTVLPANGSDHRGISVSFG
jgi:vancomycin resistance protein VanJ